MFFTFDIKKQFYIHHVELNSLLFLDYRIVDERMFFDF